MPVEYSKYEGNDMIILTPLEDDGSDLFENKPGEEVMPKGKKIQFGASKARIIVEEAEQVLGFAMDDSNAGTKLKVRPESKYPFELDHAQAQLIYMNWDAVLEFAKSHPKAPRS